MGALCSCFCVADVEELVESSNSNHPNNCICSNCLRGSFRVKCRTLFGGLDTLSIPSVESVSSSSSAPLPKTTVVDVNINVATNIKYGNLKLQKDLALKCTNPPQLDLTMQRKVNLHISSNFVIKDEAEIHHSEEDEDEDEDVCPTCLEEYTSENPKIVIQCQHSYHLSCIYEWMERNETCPICGKLMVFDETTRSSTALSG